MKILIDIGHPAHVHLFKNLIWDLEQKGHEIKITARDKDVALQLLDAYEFEYENRGKGYGGLFGKATGLMKINYRIYKIASQFKPDVLIGVHNPYIAQVGRFIRKPAIIFTDTEHAKLAGKLTFPFATVICTPSCFKKDLGKKQVRFNGYHELAYLHPNHFESDPSVLEDLGLSKDDKFIIVRFVSWEASHDIKQKGLDMQTTLKLIKEVEKHAQVFITSENPLPTDFGKYRLTITSEKIHDLLYYASLYVGEGATMATEAGILGTPSIYVSSLIGTMGTLEDLEDKYELVYSYSDSEQALKKAIELLGDDTLKGNWQKKREKLLNEKIDVTKWMTVFIEKNPGCQEKFK